MGNLKQTYLILAILFLNSCQQPNEGYQKLTKYLEKNIETHEVSESHLYFFLPDDACSGLVGALTPYFNSMKDEKRISLVLIGRSKRKLDIISKDFIAKNQLQFDTSGKAYNYNLVKPLTPTIYIISSSGEIEVKEYPEIDLQQMKEDVDHFLKTEKENSKKATANSV
ncbi:hypothetical protein [Autumnicola musiva]|uniref:DUF4174 domain-containing protein n=1 Tax=Autumnicola musiva TaxID=3075589 RepID=A0ABU3D706_9FLAO|nr:hypothetical protein [Zunongwangia sp. F117]MDT0677324.1 hypothetical protein [Zunongwangia sp. F117]